MSLITDVTDTKESVRQSKLDKHRAFNPPRSNSNRIEVDPSKRIQRAVAAASGQAVQGEAGTGGDGLKVRRAKEKKEILPAEKRKRDKERELVCPPYGVMPLKSRRKQLMFRPRPK